MSDLKILEFRERAAQGVHVPDFADLERRGTGRRRRRIATVAGTMAVVLAAGVGLVASVGGAPKTAAPPVGHPSPTTEPGVRTRMDRDEEVLRIGPSTAVYKGFKVHFNVPAPGWEWWGMGMAKRRSTDPDEYTGSIFFLADPAARQRPCRDKSVRPLGNDPDALIANVQPLVGLAGTRVLEAPRVVGVLGGAAVHLKLEITGTCRDNGDLPNQLRGTFDGEVVTPGFGRRGPLELWHAVLPGSRSVLVASWDADDSGQRSEEQRELLRSISIEAD